MKHVNLGCKSITGNNARTRETYEMIMLIKANNCMRDKLDFPALLAILNKQDPTFSDMLYGNQAMTEVDAHNIYGALHHHMSDDAMLACYHRFADGEVHQELEDLLTLAIDF